MKTYGIFHFLLRIIRSFYIVNEKLLLTKEIFGSSSKDI